MLPERLHYFQIPSWSRTDAAAGGNVVKALFRLGYSPLVLAQLRIWWAFAWLFFSALAVFGGIGLAGVQLSYYLTIAGINIAVALLVQYLGLVAVTAQVWGALAMVLAGAFFAVGAYQPALFRVNLPGVMLGFVSAGFFAFYILRASTLARRLDTWTMLLYGFGPAACSGRGSTRSAAPPCRRIGASGS